MNKNEIICPAYAGVILKLAGYWKGSHDLSRVCGGDPVVMHYNQKQFSFVPRMRG